MLINILSDVGNTVYSSALRGCSDRCS